MPLPFDATLKELVQSRTRDFEKTFGLTGEGPATVLNVDLSTITAASDTVLGYGDPVKLLVDLNFQSSRDADLPRRVLLYHALLYHRYGVPVHSLVILLRPEADDTALNGKLSYTGRPRRGRMDFRFEVVRLWQWPVKKILAGAPGTLPRAPLARMAGQGPLESQLPAIIRQIEDRLVREESPAEANRLLTAAFVLTGLRVSRKEVVQLFQGVRAMRESTAYQYILDEGRTEEARKILLRQGRKRFGSADETVQSQLQAITDLERLERMSDRVLDAASWREVLETL